MKILTVSFALISFFLGSSTVYSEESQWEYKVWQQPNNRTAVSAESNLNKFGSKGWELISVIWKQNSAGSSPAGTAVFYFKRPLSKNEEPKEPAVSSAVKQAKTDQTVEQ